MDILDEEVFEKKLERLEVLRAKADAIHKRVKRRNQDNRDENIERSPWG